jgi:hypothetical protein
MIVGVLSQEMKDKKKRKKSKEVGLDYLDNLWKELVYKRAGNECEYCGQQGRLNAHHVFSRSNRSVRWDMDNGICLCATHHVLGTMSFHKAPAEMLEWIREKRGEEWYDRLLKKARSVMKGREAKEHFKNELKKLKEEV